MKSTHTHHILPKYRGGGDNPSNLIELTPTQHAMFHYANWCLWEDWRDRSAHLCISKQIGKEEARVMAMRGVKKTRTPKLLKEYESRKGRPKNLSMEGKEKRSRSLTKHHAEGIYIQNNTYQWELTYSDGTIVVIDNLNKYCKEQGMHSNYLSELCHKPNGRRKSHKGVVRVKKLNKVYNGVYH